MARARRFTNILWTADNPAYIENLEGMCSVRTRASCKSKEKCSQMDDELFSKTRFKSCHRYIASVKLKQKDLK